MPLWIVAYYPPSGESDSPYDKIQSIDDVKEAASIDNLLEMLADLTYMEWSCHVKLKPVVKKYNKLLQITDGNYRVYLSLSRSEKKIIVLHVCRKVGRKAKPEDINRAVIHYREYFER